MASVSVGQLAILGFVGLLCWAFVCDSLTLKIPNKVSLGIVALYPAWVLASWPTIGLPWLSVVIAMAVLAVGFVINELGLMGGGDAKLLAATALWAGPGLVFELIAVTTVMGGLVALAVVLAAFVRHREVTARGEAVAPFLRNIAKSKYPYGIAIAVGGFVVAAGLWV